MEDHDIVTCPYCRKDYYLETLFKAREQIAALRERAESAERELVGYRSDRNFWRGEAERFERDRDALKVEVANLKGELKEILEMVLPGSEAAPILAKIRHKIEGIPGMEVK